VAGFWGLGDVKLTSHLGGCKSDEGPEVTMQVHRLSANARNGNSDSQAFLLGGIIVMVRKVKLVHGVGINDAGYIVQPRSDGHRQRFCPFYQTWVNVLQRCYSEAAKRREKNLSYFSCLVDHDWHRFSSFRSWMISQPWQGNEVDKDLMFPGNSVYGPEQCVFISPDLNKFTTSCTRSRGVYPVGVCFNKGTGKFVAYCRNPFAGKQDHLGYFVNPELSHEVWRKTKHAHALVYADMQDDERVAAALRIRYLPENLHKIGM
jgi:hypothetical protein